MTLSKFGQSLKQNVKQMFSKNHSPILFGLNNSAKHMHQHNLQWEQMKMKISEQTAALTEE